MKYLSSFFLLLLCLNSCKKEEKITQNSTAKDSLNIVKDPLSANVPLTVVPLNIFADKGKTVFSQDKRTMFFFDTQSNTGEININGKTYALDLLNFTDNEYHISGKDVKITATEGDFKEKTGDCLYGKFAGVKVELNHQEVILKDISVQDCPAY
ncbi:MAG: hypothetical protein H7195_03815 [Chryseobacterium sp.]|nr:hypothetical protein [Chryseobacterium sp.]